MQPLDVPVRQGLRFLHAWDPDKACEVTGVADGVVHYLDDAGGEHADEEAWFGDVVGLVLDDAPAPLDPPVMVADSPLHTSAHGAVLDGLDAAVITSIEDTVGQYSGQVLPSNSGYTLNPTDDFLREQIGVMFNDGLMDFREARRLRELLGDELPPVVRADDFD